MVEVVGGNDEEAEGDDNGVEEVVGVQDGILQRLACIRISWPVLPRTCTHRDVRYRKFQVLSRKQCFGSGFNQVGGSGYRRAKLTHKNRKKLRNFMFWSAGCSLLRAEGLLLYRSLDVLNEGLGISKLQFLIKKISIFFSCEFVFVFCPKNPGSGSGSRYGND